MKRQDTLRLGRRVRVEPQCGGADVDCRLLFMGDRCRQLVRTYPEAIHRLSRRGGAAAVAAYVKESPEILQFYDVHERDDQVGLLMRDEVFREPGRLDDLDFELSVSDGTHRTRYPLPLEGFTALGALLPLLGGDRSEQEVLAALESRMPAAALTWTLELLARLRSDGFVVLESGRDPNFLLRSSARPRVTFVAHTSVLVQSAQTAVVFDPLLRSGLGLHHGGRDVARLDLGAICLSHSHWDHCDVASLLLFDKRTPVVIPSVRRPTAFNPPMKSMLMRLGFEDIREVTLWTPVQISDIEVIPVPFHGEQDEPEAEIDHYTYVVRTGELTVYGGVDAFQDTFGDMNADLERVRRKYKPTVAFLPVSRMTYAYAHGGVNGFCRSVDTTLLDKSFQYTAGPDVAVNWVRTLDTPWVVPYATFTFDRPSPAPQAGEFADELANAGMLHRLIALRPLDSLELVDLNGGMRANLRRAFLRRWLRATSAGARLHERIQHNLAYRALRRLLGRPRAAAAHHH